MTNAIVGAIVLVYLYCVVTWRRAVENHQGISTERSTQATEPERGDAAEPERAANQSRRLASGDACSSVRRRSAHRDGDLEAMTALRTHARLSVARA